MGDDQQRSSGSVVPGYEMYSYEGIATFAGCPYVPDVQALVAARPDVAVIGAPFDISTTYRPGARFGPRALRAQAYHPGTYHLDLEIEIFEALRVVDFGDAHCPHGLTERSHANIRAHVGNVARHGIIPVVIGGDHSITAPSATAVADHFGWGKIGIVHFDAHADTADVIDGNYASHGTPMRRLIESGAVLGRNFVQVGLRGYWPGADVFAWMKDQGMRWHLMQEVWERGSAAVMETAVAEAMEGCDALYVSVDIDVLDPGYAPGTGTPEPGGMTPADLLRAIRLLGMTANVVALDVVEVSPPYDHSEQTINNAHRVIFEMLSGIAWKRRAEAHRSEA